MVPDALCVTLPSRLCGASARWVLFSLGSKKTTTATPGTTSIAVAPVLTCDARISINISIGSLCTSEDSRDISISVSFLQMFSEDIVDISISARRLADRLALMLMLMSTCLHWTLQRHKHKHKRRAVFIWVSKSNWFCVCYATRLA